MTQIAGILRFDRAVSLNRVDGMLAAMKPARACEAGQWSDDHIGIGACRLSPLSADFPPGPPLVHHEGSLVLVIDGEVHEAPDNLTRNKERSGGAAATRAQSARIVLAAFERWGSSCAQHLVGDFAFAIWDRAARRLYCAADRMGARPFFYALQNDCFGFASSEEALLQLPGMSAQANEELIATCFVPEFVDYDPERSWLRDVSILRAGQSLVIDLGRQLHKTRYWVYDNAPLSHFRSNAECTEAFQDVFDRAVADRIPLAGAYGMMLSGGLDSATVLWSIARKDADYRDRLHAYSVVQEDADCVESRCIRSLQRQYGTAARTVDVAAGATDSTIRELSEQTWAMAHPIDNGTLLPLLMCLVAAQDGREVLLHAASGDVTLDTPDRYIAHVMRLEGLRRAWTECRAASNHHTYLRGRPALRLLLENAWTAYVPGSIKKYVHPPRRNFQQSLLSESLARRLDLAGRLRATARLRNEARAFSMDAQAPFNQLLNSANGISRGLVGYARIGARFGVATLDPWGDYRVVEFFRRLPLSYKVSEGWCKSLVRHSLPGGAGDGVRWRVGKEHLGQRLISQVMDATHGGVIRDLYAGLDELADYIDVKKFRHLLSNYSSSHASAKVAWSDERASVFQVASLLAWTRRLGGTSGVFGQ